MPLPGITRALKARLSSRKAPPAAPLPRTTQSGEPIRNASGQEIVNSSDVPSFLPVSEAAPNRTIPLPDNEPSESHVPATKEDLWDLAYEHLEKDEEKRGLIEKYKDIILAGDSAGSSTTRDDTGVAGREQQMSKVVQDKLQAVKDARWKFTICSKEIEVRKQYDRVVGSVIWAKDFITQAVQPDPHAALAWAGVCIVLPLLLNPSLQRNAAIEGLDSISNLIRQSKVIDEIYAEKAAGTSVKTKDLQALAEAFKAKRIDLYSRILEFEAQLVCYFSINKVEQTLQDLIKYNDWGQMVEDIQKIATLSYEDRNIIDAERMKAGFENLEKGMESTLLKLDGISKMIENEFSMKRHRREDKKRLDILSWLSPLDFGTKQSITLSSRQEGTGEWLFEHQAFGHWLCGAERRLWCPGIPGAGKTVLASAIIDYLKRRFYNDGVGIAFLYCSYKERDAQNTLALIGSLVRQLAERHVDIPTDIKVLYDDNSSNRNTPTPPTIRQCLDLLKSLISSCPATFLVIDALDECDDETRTEFCTGLRELPENVHLLFTSRDILELGLQIEPSAQLDIRASKEDIMKYLEDHIKTANRLEQHVKDPMVRDEVIKTICEKADGMFLLAHLHLASLANKHNLKAVRKALSELPTSLDATYNTVMERITTQKDEDRQLGIKVLSWIVYTKRPLTVAEMQHAIAVEPTTTSLEEEDLTSKDIFVSVCAGIVTVDQKSNVIRLVHYSAQEYLQRNGSVYFPDAEQEIAHTCLTYLLFENFKDGYCKTDQALEYLLEKNPLLDYAARNWAVHTHEPTEIFMRVALEFLKDPSRTSLSHQVMEVDSYHYPGYSQNTPQNMPGLHLCAYLGMDVLVTRMLETLTRADVQSKDSYDRTPLCVAARRGHEAIVKLLLATEGVDADSKDKYGQTPLCGAAMEGHEAIVKLLLATERVDADSKDRDGQTPLSWAARGGHEAIVKLLLATEGVDADSKDEYSRTPLWWAAEGGHEAIVKLLLATEGVNADSKNEEGQTPLFVAAEGGHEANVKLLLATERVNADSKDEEGQTPLSWAARGGHKAIVKLLLATKRVDADSKDEYSQTPLSWAARGGHEAIVKLLLATEGVNADSKNEEGQTLLSWAADRGHDAIVKLLVEAGAT